MPKNKDPFHARETLSTPLGSRTVYRLDAVGDLVGEVGATGRATGPHLDWRVNWFAERLDPALLVGPMPAARATE